MALTGRAALLALAGAVVVLLVPAGGATVGLVAAVIAGCVVVDVALAASPRAVALSRTGATSTRLGEEAMVVLSLVNTGPRRLRGWVRDGWPPSAGARPRAHRVDIASGARTRLTTTLVPERRGERRAAAVTLRTTGPLGVAARQRSRTVPW